MNGHSKVPVAIIGGGSIAPYHAKYLQSSSTCELVAIIDPFQSGQDLARKLSVQHYKTLSELESVAVYKPEIYYVCVPSSLHVGLATEVLQTCTTAKVIMVEKPLSTESVSGEQLLSLANSKACTIAVGHHRRFHPAIKAARQAIEAGRLGKLTAISGLWACKKNDGYFDICWRVSRSAGGGPVWTNFVHDIDLLHYLVGSHVQRLWVTSTVNRRDYKPVKVGDAVEEGAAIMLQFKNGVVGTFILSDNVSSPYAWEVATGENPLMPKADVAIDCFRLFGSDGTLTVPDGNLWTYRRDEACRKGLEIGWNVPMIREVLEVTEGIPFQDQAEHLARVARGKERPICSGFDGLVAVKVCEAIIRALECDDGMPVDIEYSQDATKSERLAFRHADKPM